MTYFNIWEKWTFFLINMCGKKGKPSTFLFSARQKLPPPLAGAIIPYKALHIKKIVGDDPFVSKKWVGRAVFFFFGGGGLV